MESATDRSPYLSQLVSLPAAAAAVALDAHRLDLVGLRVDDPSVLLALNGRVASEVGSDRYEAIRTLEATLTFGRTQIDVGIELLPWSATSSELNIRPARGDFPRMWSARRHSAYARAATAVLRALATELELMASPTRRRARRTVAA